MKMDLMLRVGIAILVCLCAQAIKGWDLKDFVGSCISTLVFYGLITLYEYKRKGLFPAQSSRGSTITISKNTTPVAQLADEVKRAKRLGTRIVFKEYEASDIAPYVSDLRNLGFEVEIC